MKLGIFLVVFLGLNLHLGANAVELNSKTSAVPFPLHVDDLPGQDLLTYGADKPDVRRLNLDMPEWVIQALDKEASRRGITRQALIKTWIVDKLDYESQERKAPIS
jgi:hypothetical protein